MDILHPAYRIKEAHTPLITAAIHAGHDLRYGLAPYFAIDENTRLRDEDPGTDILAGISDTSIVSRQSRFVVDFNRKRRKSVYLYHKDNAGAQVWKNGLPENELEISRKYYNDFYNDLRFLLDRTVEQHGHFLIYDIHSYNYRHTNPGHLLAHHGAYPDIKIGTGRLNREKWQGLVHRFIRNLSSFSIKGRPLIVREYTRASGGAFANWIYRNYGDAACVLTLSFKKTYIDERNGGMDHHLLAQLKHALASTTAGTLRDLERINKKSELLSPYYVNGSGQLLQLNGQL